MSEENKSDSQGKKRSLFGRIADWNNRTRQKLMSNAEARIKENNENFKKKMEAIDKEMEKHKKEISPGEYLLCPKCGSENFEFITETSTTGKNVSGSKACCGYILMGPFGLLCGFCGKGKQTKSETFCMCKDCGNKFQKMTTLGMMSMSDAERAKYHEFQAAAKKRHGVVDVEEVKDTAEKDSSAENDTASNNQ